jgi:DNA-binding GntR family transcriptional regulator
MRMTGLEHEGAAPRQSDEAFERIKGEIILCRLPPGTHFSEAQLSRRFGLPRAGTRAALMRLAEIGLVQPVPRHGFIVAPITMASLRELFELRLMVEPQAAALAAGKVDVDRLRALDASPQRAQSDEEQLAFVNSNRAFHREIALASGNSRLSRLLESLGDEMQRLVHLGLFGSGGNDAERHNAEAQHEALIAALASGDRIAAEQAARRHIEHARTLALASITSGFSSFALS